MIKFFCGKKDRTVIPCTLPRTVIPAKAVVILAKAVVIPAKAVVIPAKAVVIPAKAGILTNYCLDEKLLRLHSWKLE